MHAFKVQLPQRWVLPIACFFLLILIAILEIPILQTSGGMMIYPQDECYTRLAIGRWLAFDGTWGISPHMFSSASSSLLYPVILAGFFKIVGPQPVIPFLINLAAALAFIVSLQKWLQQQQIRPMRQVLVLCTIIYFIPLHVMVVNGMEHTLQILFCFLFLFKFCEWFSMDEQTDGAPPVFPWILYVYGIIVATLRYEGLFLILPVCIALLVKKRWRAGLLLGGLALLPIVLFGVYSLSKEGYFIPNTIMLKAMPLPLDLTSIQHFFTDEIFNKLVYPYPTRGNTASSRLLILLPLVYWLYIDVLRVNARYRYILLFCLVMTIEHLLFANVLLFYRYEAYLVACDLVVPSTLVARYGLPMLTGKGRPVKWVVAWLCLFLTYPFFSRTWGAHREANYGLFHEYLQNYQAAQFLKRYYNDRVVVMDELGLASFLSPGRKLDIVAGNAYVEVTSSKVDGFTRPEYIDFLIKKEKPVIALISEKQYHPYLIQYWKKVSAWKTIYKLPMGDNELDIYAVDTLNTDALRKDLRAFEQHLPDGVKVDPK